MLGKSQKEYLHPNRYNRAFKYGFAERYNELVPNLRTFSVGSTFVVTAILTSGFGFFGSVLLGLGAAVAVSKCFVDILAFFAPDPVKDCDGFKKLTSVTGFFSKSLTEAGAREFGKNVAEEAAEESMFKDSVLPSF